MGSRLLKDLPPLPALMATPEPFLQLLEIASSNPDLNQFQQTLNSWLKKNLRCKESLIVLISAETQSAQCQVYGNCHLDIPIVVSSASSLTHAMEEKGFLSSEQLPESFVRRLEAGVAGEGGSLPPFLRLFPLRAKIGLVAALCVFSDTQGELEECCTLVQAQLPVISALFAIVYNVDRQRRLAEQSQIFLNMAQNVFSSLDDMSDLVRNITKEAKQLIQAETCSLFLLDKEHSELVAEVFEKNGLNDEYLTEIRLPADSGIAGAVASSGTAMNVQDAYNHALFYKKVDERTGFHTRNILCFPIKNSAGETIGVAELCNKLGAPAFSQHDEKIAATFSVYCAISISHCLLYRKLQEAHRRTHLASELMVYDTHIKVAEEDVLRLSLREVPPVKSLSEEFHSFSFLPRTIQPTDSQLLACTAMFADLGFIDRWRLKRKTLAKFLLMVQKGYRDVPYHNWSHAFAVGHFTFLLLKLSSVQSRLSDLEMLSFFVASLCHDVDHRGTNNAFQVQSKTPLAHLYSSEGSVLERHHFAQTMCILNMDDCNIFENVPAKDYNKILDNIRDIILATDVSQHMRKVDKIQTMIKGGYEPSNKEHHYLFLGLLMTASDLSDQTKPWRASKAIAASIYTEFFSQGDLEKAMGNRPSEMMDRDRAWIPHLQIDFLNSVAVPVYRMLGDLVEECEPVHKSIGQGRDCWEMMNGMLSSDQVPRCLDILRDEGLESRVLDRMSETSPLPPITSKLDALRVGGADHSKTEISDPEPSSN